MKKSIPVILALLTATAMMAQKGNNGILLTGSVIYEQMVKLDIQLEGDAAQFAHMLPKEKKSEKILHFTEEASLYENFHSEEPEEEMDMHGGANVMIKMAEPDNKVFTDLTEGKQIEQKEFMSRIFLIEKEVAKGAWKITGAQKTILDYPCMEATTEEEDKTVRVWFTSSIAVPAGPVGYSNLPGLVLGVDINDGERTIQAKAIDLKEIDKGILKKPGKGKKVSEEEYQAIVEEKMKEMGAEGEAGSGHAVVVKIHR